jgi:hypothetical protein
MPDERSEGKLDLDSHLQTHVFPPSALTAATLLNACMIPMKALAANASLPLA